MKQINLSTIQKLKQNNEKITCLTAYDASFAHLISHAEIEILLIGDSLGHVIQAHPHTIPVTIDDVCYHTRCVVNGNINSFIIADMPFMSFATENDAFANAKKLMQSGAHMVKCEGCNDWLIPIVQQLCAHGIPVCGHIGLAAQSVHQLGGYKIQGRNKEQAEQLIKMALALEKAGAQLLVLECMPTTLAKLITEQLTIPTIGIGAGADCNGQVLVSYDILGLTGQKLYTFAKNFMHAGGPDAILKAFIAYRHAVKSGQFPLAEHGFE
jgi:3-methyl-2-oxobutanoate hydroxymethyltransferase